MVKRARLIYNPTSGREEMKKKLPDILQRLEQGGIETSCHATTCEGDATRAAAEAVQRGFDIVISAGGDGTLNEVINGLAEKNSRPALGILPLGTTNDFARALGIPKQLEAACDLITRQHVKLIDVGKVNQRYFINVAGGGYMTELTYEVPSKLKTMLGQLAYYMKGLEKLPYLHPINLVVESEERNLEEKVMLFLIANSNYVGGHEKIAPEADLSDGLFDVFIMKKCNLAEFVRVVSLALRGEHLNDPNVIYFKTKQIKVSSSDYTQLNLDGEFGGTLPCSFSVLPSHIQIFVDESGHTSYKNKSGVNQQK
jgi:diacylglycerol kinase (ATP)